MRRIISANWRDRSSPDCWLVRDEGQHPDQAVAFRSVEATGVEFCQASTFELGFGCAVVAVCETAVGHGDDATTTQDGVRLRFSGPVIAFDVSRADQRAAERELRIGFVNTQTNETVERVDRLWLNPDRTMYATITPPAASRRTSSRREHASV